MAPKISFTVCEPVPNSGVLVLPTVIAPASRIRRTIGASVSGTWSAKIGEPYVVRIPAVSARSLCATGRPCSGPRHRPRARSRSASSASRLARSATSVTIALTSGLTSSIRRRCASSSSTAPTCLVRSSSIISVAVK